MGQEQQLEQDSDLGLYSPEVENVSNAAQSMHNRTIGGAGRMNATSYRTLNETVLNRIDYPLYETREEGSTDKEKNATTPDSAATSTPNTSTPNSGGYPTVETEDAMLIIMSPCGIME